MKRITRRQFTKLAGGATLAVGALAQSARAQEAQPPAPKPKLTPEQEERVKEAVTRRDRQLAPLRNRTLPYALEPAFLFRALAKTGGRG